VPDSRSRTQARSGDWDRQARSLGPVTTTRQISLRIPPPKRTKDGDRLSDGGSKSSCLRSGSKHQAVDFRTDRRPGECRNAISQFLMPSLLHHTREISTPIAPSTIGHFCPIYCSAVGGKVDKRDCFTGELRHKAKLRGLSFRVEHAATRVATPRFGWAIGSPPFREIAPKTVRKIRKSLGLD